MENEEKKVLNQSYQQGDVKFRRVGDAVMPEGAKVVQKGKRIVVGVGEGHHEHVVTLEPETETDAELIAMGEKMLLLIREPAQSRHEVINQPGSQADHKPRMLAPGLWEIGSNIGGAGGIREVDHLAQQERRVID